MARILSVEEISESGRTKLAELDGVAPVMIGREPDDGGLALQKGGGVSREHGCLFREGKHWFYRDEESTNGSWINGNKVKSGSFTVIRDRDVIQMADAAVQVAITETGEDDQQDPDSSGRSALLFRGDRFLKDFNIPEYGKALVIGGKHCNVEIDGDLSEAPSLVVERRGSSVVAYNIAKQNDLLRNGELVDGTSDLTDRDELTLLEFKIIYNSPASGSKGTLSSLRGFDEPSDIQAPPAPYSQTATTGFQEPGAGQSGGQSQWLNSFDNSDTHQGSGMGTSGSGEITQAINMGTGGGFGQGTGSGGINATSFYPQEEEEEEVSYSSMEDKIVLALVLVLLLALIGLGMYFFLA